MAIAAMVLWLLAAAAGVSLLKTGGAARRAAARAARGAAVSSGPAAAEAARTAAVTTSAATTRPAVLPVTADGKPVRPPPARVTAPPGEHPLLEFSHPALALIGSACWLMYVFTRYQQMAWVAFGILVATMVLGLTWLTRTRRAARRPAGTAWAFPPRLAALHGLAVAAAITLTVLTVLTASRA